MFRLRNSETRGCATAAAQKLEPAPSARTTAPKPETAPVTQATEQKTGKPLDRDDCKERIWELTLFVNKLMNWAEKERTEGQIDGLLLSFTIASVNIKEKLDLIEKLLKLDSDLKGKSGRLWTRLISREEQGLIEDKKAAKELLKKVEEETRKLEAGEKEKEKAAETQKKGEGSGKEQKGKKTAEAQMKGAGTEKAYGEKAAETAPKPPEKRETETPEPIPPKFKDLMMRGV